MPGQFGRKPLPAPDGVPVLLGSLVHERTGILFEGERCGVLVEKLEPLAHARGCHSLLDYYYVLKYQEDSTAEWAQVMDAISVQETYFWREMPQIRALVDVLTPEWFQKSSMPLRIWSAAAATGEEPYTIALALVEAGWGNHPIEIVASDASPSALQHARAAVYRERSFRALPAEHRAKYFTQVDKNGWQLREDIMRRVKFERANLLAPQEFSHLARSRVVFCRNVFIYFSPHAIRQTLAGFAARMPRGGCLFVGASESLLRLTADFELREIQDAFAYVRS